MGERRYQARGFVPFVSPPARITRLAADVDIIKGNILVDDGNGYATNGAAEFETTILGVAAADCLNAVAAGLSVEIYPFDRKTLYIVPIGSAVVIDRGDVGVYADLQSAYDIDIAVPVTEGISFFVEDIDISTKAIDANTEGYAIGRFRNITAAQAP